MKRVRRYFEFLKKHSTTLLFVSGFLTDMFLLPDVDDPLTKYIGFAYIVGIGALIAFREWVISKNRADELERKLFSLSSFGIAYLSGSALSFVFVYALRSAALSVSWPLFLILLISMIANEFFSNHTYRFTLDIMVLFIAVVFYIVFNMPFLLKTQNDTVFALSALGAMVVAFVYSLVIHKISETTEEEASKMFALSFGVPMFIAMLYFLNLIPAVPLSLREGMVLHNVEREEGGDYRILEEKDTRFLSSLRRQIHTITTEDNDVFYFSIIDAPALITAPITHVWEYYDREKREWVEVTKVSFTLSGGREGGYRAYSHKENIKEGLWRVTVKVDEERIVGRTTFTIQEGKAGELIENTF
jgi:uncharacterized membrane protein